MAQQLDISRGTVKTQGQETAPARAAGCEANEWRPSGDGQRSAIELLEEE